MRRPIAPALLIALLWTAGPVAAQQADVRALQHALVEQGYDPGPVDGFWGGRTEAALNAFQRENGFAESENVSEDQLVLLGLRAPEPETADAPGSAETEMPAAEPSPIVGDLTEATELYARLASQSIFLQFENRAGLKIVATDSHPLTVTFTEPDENGYYASPKVGGTAYVGRQIRVEAVNLQGHPGMDFLLEMFEDPEGTLRPPDTVCRELPASTAAFQPTHFCIDSGSVRFGGTYSAEGNAVSCTAGGMMITNANRDQTFDEGTVCTVNGNPVRLGVDGWMESG